MNARRLLTDHLLTALGTVAAGMLAVGLFLGLTGRFGETVGVGAPVAQAASATVTAAAMGIGKGKSKHGTHVVALGDSLSAGTGDARAGGYPARLVGMLAGTGAKATLVNLAVPGAESVDVLARMNDEAVRRHIASADLIVVSAGGNDLMHTLRPRAGHALLEPEQAARRAGANLQTLIYRLRAENPHALVRLIGLYNPFEVLPADEPAARAQLLAWNNLIEEATHPYRGVLMIHVSDLLDGRPDRLAKDRYHPGPAGHELIARRLLETIPPHADLSSASGN